MFGNGLLAQLWPARWAYLIAQPWPWTGWTIINNHFSIFQLCHKYFSLQHSAVPWGGLITRYRCLRLPSTYRNDKHTQPQGYRYQYYRQGQGTSQRHRAVSGVLHQGLLGPHSSAFSDCIARASTRQLRQSSPVDLHTVISSRHALVELAEWSADNTSYHSTRKY